MRDLAHREAEARGRCFDQSKQAYQHGDGAHAKELSNQGKQHDVQCENYNQQAAMFVFRANNSRAAPDEIDLHGLYVEEAVKVVEERINACIQRQDDHLHVIV